MKRWQTTRICCGDNCARCSPHHKTAHNTDRRRTPHWCSGSSVAQHGPLFVSEVAVRGRHSIVLWEIATEEKNWNSAIPCWLIFLRWERDREISLRSWLTHGTLLCGSARVTSPMGIWSEQTTASCAPAVRDERRWSEENFPEVAETTDAEVDDASCA